jgi:regulator of PEP synthase PpsR (kinase-PPPase family)
MNSINSNEENQNNKKLCTVYMISDSSGETVSTVMKSIAAQLLGIKIESYLYPLVQSKNQIDEILEEAHEQNAVILCTMADESLFTYLVQNAKAKGIICIEILSKIIKELARYFEAKIIRGTKNHHNDNYFYRMDAINFALEHDDGQGLETISDADIVIVGLSRTSKSPTSIYLANMGYKVANVPFIVGIQENLPKELLNLISKKFIIALSIDSQRLMLVRQERVNHLSNNMKMNYIDISSIDDENKIANAFYKKEGWPVIDVTDRSVEEIAALIIQKYNSFIK